MIYSPRNDETELELMIDLWIDAVEQFLYTLPAEPWDTRQGCYYLYGEAPF